MLVTLFLTTVLAPPPLPPGDHDRTIKVDGRPRSYHVHVPPQYDPAKPIPVVIALHGGGTNASMMAKMSQLSKKSDEAGFLVIYPNGTGIGLLNFNAGGRRDCIKDEPDDVKYIGAVLDEVGCLASIDSKRIYATGLSNGGMMCYRLAAEMSDRIAAIAPVAGTMAIEKATPTKPVPIMHFHGTADKIVPPTGPARGTPSFLTFKTLDETLQLWRKINECPDKAQEVHFEDKAKDGTTVRQLTYGPGKNGSEVILIEIEGGGHTWPGHKSLIPFLGKTTLDISANDLMWDFFQRHSRN
jgi:polyhydroxybutyrate depolymerase